MNDRYAIRADSVPADGSTAGTETSAGSASAGKWGAGEDSTRGDTSNSGGTGIAAGGAPIGSGGSSGTGGEPSTMGGAARETDGTSGGVATGGVATGGVATGGATGEAGAIAAAGEAESDGSGGTESGGSPSAGQGGIDSSTGNAGTDGTDECPQDASKVSPGVCGCGTAEADCLAHRYSFDGSGTSVVDSIGSDDGTIRYGTLSGDGGLAFSDATIVGANATYVDFPDGILSSLSSATLELWVTWAGGGNHQRILDFGNRTQSGLATSGKTYVFLTPKHSLGTARASFSLNGPDFAKNINASAALSIGKMSQLAIVFDGTTNDFRLYVNGISQNSASMPGPLSAINDVNNWLGRSQFNDDPYFSGTIHEFRIYKVALTQRQISASFDAGPDVPSGE